MGIFHEEIKRLRAEAIRLRSYNEGLAKIAAQQDEQIERLRAALSDTVETLEAMDLHVDNPLYDRLRRALEQYGRGPTSEGAKLAAEINETRKLPHT